MALTKVSGSSGEHPQPTGSHRHTSFSLDETVVFWMVKDGDI